MTVDGDTWALDGVEIYAEKNWGANFPDLWWWGQAHGFRDRDLGVAFGGGRLRAGPAAIDVTGCVLRAGPDVVRFAPPLAHVRAHVGDGAWHVTARRPGWRLSIDADGNGNRPAVLPVPVPAERRNVQQDFEHLAGRLRLRAWRSGSFYVDDETHLAGLEAGSTDPDHAAQLADSLGAPSADGAPSGSMSHAIRSGAESQVARSQVASSTKWA